MTVVVVPPRVVRGRGVAQRSVGVGPEAAGRGVVRRDGDVAGGADGRALPRLEVAVLLEVEVDLFCGEMRTR